MMNYSFFFKNNLFSRVSGRWMRTDCSHVISTYNSHEQSVVRRREAKASNRKHNFGKKSRYVSSCIPYTNVHMYMRTVFSEWLAKRLLASCKEQLNEFLFVTRFFQDTCTLQAEFHDISLLHHCGLHVGRLNVLSELVTKALWMIAHHGDLLGLRCQFGHQRRC